MAQTYLEIYLIEQVKIAGEVCQVDIHFDDMLKT